MWISSTEEKVNKKSDKKLFSKKEKDEKTKETFVQDFLPIKDIRGGIIITKDERYIKILEIDPINFMLRSDEEKEGIIMTFASFLKISNIKVQFKSITKRADSEKYIELLKNDMIGELNDKTKDLSKAYIKLIRDVGSQEALTRRFFLIFEYEQKEQQKDKNFLVIHQTLNQAAQTAKNCLENCGNHVKVPKNQDMATGEMLYMFFNRRSSLKETFNQRIQRCVADTMIQQNLTIGIDPIPDISPINFIAPRGIDLSHSRYVIMDGLYYSTMYVKSDGYPLKVKSGWMSALINAGDGVDVDLYLSRQNRSKTIDSVKHNMINTKLKLRETQESSSDYEEVRDAYYAAQFIKEGIAQQQDLFYMNILFTVNAPTLEELQWKKSQLKDVLKSRDIEVAETWFRQEDGLLSVMPLCNIQKNIYERSKRNVLTATAASTYMFTSFEMCDDSGILLGVNEYNNTLCIIDLFNAKLYKNANMTIIGTSGAGKTFTEQLMALRMRMRGIQCFIIAPLKGHEFKRACHNIGGEFIKISSGSPHCINVMEIHYLDNSSEKAIDNDDSEGIIDSLLARKIEQLNIFFSLLLPDMTNEEEQLLDEALIDVYLQKGITYDNNSLFIEGTNTLKRMPVLGDLYNILKENVKMQGVATIISRFVTGSARSFNHQTNVDLSNKYIVFDISELKGKMLSVGMFIALDYCWDKIKEDRTKKKAIFMDETWALIGANSNKYAAEFVLEIFKIIRGYGGGAIAATQDLNDFFALEDGKYGRGIINNSKTKIILQLEPDEAESVKEILKLSRVEIHEILNFERGHALIASNNNKVPVEIRASELEKSLITTDREELAKQVEARKREKLKNTKIVLPKDKEQNSLNLNK